MGKTGSCPNSYWYLYFLYLALGIASSSIEYQPLGLVLVISAWNYPIYTALPQVAAAIAAGNSVILKPS